MPAQPGGQLRTGGLSIQAGRVSESFKIVLIVAEHVPKPLFLECFFPFIEVIYANKMM